MPNKKGDSIWEGVDIEKTESYNQVMKIDSSRSFAKWMIGLFVVFLILLFMPWTQNINAKGKVNSLKPEQRPQSIQATIPGRIEKWYVQEGQLVKKGDPIVEVSEVKDEYFDPKLIERTSMQAKAKEASVSSYSSKAEALTRQVQALEANRLLNLEQARNKVKQGKLKVQSDSINYIASITEADNILKQFDRLKTMYTQGVRSLVDLERLEIRVRETAAKRLSAENKWLEAKNELLNARIEINSIQSDYDDKIAKSRSERFSTLASQYDAEADVTKMNSEFSKFSVRAENRTIRAQQDCYITKVFIPGIGEVVKSGDELLSILPAVYELAVELFIKPMDLPLVKIGSKARFLFDGWPALVFSGWPQLTFGTFAGKVVAIDNIANKNGEFRLLIAQDADDEPWPKALRPGSGANGILLLGTVPVYFEIWRQLNGFPPDFYSDTPVGDKNFKDKPPIKSLK